jgi:hypothetical protein
MTPYWFQPRDAAESAARYWWLFIITGVSWLAVSMIWSRSVILLVAFVGASTLFRGVTAIVFGFKLLQLHRDPRSLTAKPTETAATRTPQPA